MSEQTPKLYTHKPKKAQIKQFQEKLKKAKELNNPLQSSAAAASYSAGPPPPSPPPPPTSPPPRPPKESFFKRLKFLVPLFVTVNLAIGAYLFMRTKKKDTATEEEEVPTVPSTPVSAPAAPTAPVIEKIVNQSIAEPVKPREPVPEDQQRELFKWILEEKRKIKPKDPEEKKRIDDEKAVLKQFIRAKSIPSIK